MKISAITSSVYKAKQSPAFKGDVKPLINVEGVKDDEIVGYSTWGANYAYPIYARDIKNTRPTDSKVSASPQNTEESRDEYLARKLYSSEWCL